MVINENEPCELNGCMQIFMVIIVIECNGKGKCMYVYEWCNFECCIFWMVGNMWLAWNGISIELCMALKAWLKCVFHLVVIGNWKLKENVLTNGLSIV